MGAENVVFAHWVVGPEDFERGRVKTLRVPLALDDLHAVPVSGDDEIQFAACGVVPMLNAVVRQVRLSGARYDCGR